MNDDSFLISRAVRSVVAVLVTLALSLAGGCATTASPAGTGPAAYATLAAVVIDAQRLARPDELGQVRVWRGTALVPTQARMALQPGDLVMTGPNAYAVLHYDKAEVLLRPSSQGRVGSLTDLIGEAFAKIRGAFSVETSFVRAGANGTAYLVRGSSDGAAEVTVFDGTVTLSSRIGAWPPQPLPTGATAFCPPRSGAPQVRPASVQELEQTRAWVERIEKVAAPRTRYGTVAAVAVIGVLIGAILSDRGGRDRPADKAPSGGDPLRGRAGQQGTQGGTPPPPPSSPQGGTDAAGRATTVQPTTRYPARERPLPPAPGPVVR